MAKELILITGITGYIGFKVLQLALVQGNRVRGIVRRQEQITIIRNHHRLTNFIDRLELIVVPDLTLASAFDSVLDNVSVIIHLASPLAKETDDYVRDIVQPPLDIVSSLLSSASNTASIRRVIITSSAVTLIPMSWLSSSDGDTVFTSRSLNTDTSPPYQNAMEAYWASKAIARQHVHEFLRNNHPHFDIIQLLPSVVFGPDDWAIDLDSFFVGTRSMIVPIVQGINLQSALVGAPVLVDDVARAHVDAVQQSVPGNRDYILSSDTPEGIQWNSILDIAREHFPEAIESGLLKCTGSLPTRKWLLDVSDTTKAFGWHFTSFDETVKRQIAQYIYLLKQQQSVS